MKNMKNIQNYEEFVNESWRQVKPWLKLPKYLLDKLLGLILPYIPRLPFMYDELSANIDLGKSLSLSTVKDEPIKLTLDDVKNDKVRKHLKMTNFFNNWNVYTFDREKYEGRVPVYITKDELKIGDEIHGERISESEVDKNYGMKNKRKYFKSKGVKNISELEPQFWVVAAKHTEEHDKMKDERSERYDKKTKKELDKLVNKCIKDDNLWGRTKQIFNQWDNKPIIFKVVEADRIDLAKKLIEACEDEEDLRKMINVKIDGEDWPFTGDKRWKDDKDVFDYVKSDEMRELLEPYRT